MDVFGTDSTAIGRVLLGAVPAVVAIAGLSRGPGAMRSRLKHDVELLEKFPPDIEARSKYEAYLAVQVERLTKLETESSRDIQGLVVSVFMVVAFGALALYLFSLDGWWWWVGGVAVTVFCLAGLSSMFDDAQRVPRDSKGKRI